MSFRDRLLGSLRALSAELLAAEHLVLVLFDEAVAPR